MPPRLPDRAPAALAPLCASVLLTIAPAEPTAHSAEFPPPSAGHALVDDDSLHRVLLLNAGLGGMDDARPHR